MNNSLKQFLVGALCGAVVAGVVVYVWQEERLQREQQRSEVALQLLDATSKQVPLPPFPPDVRELE